MMIARSVFVSSVHAKQPNMKKISIKKRTKGEDYELRDEYDLSKMSIVAKGRFAPHRRVGLNIIVLAPELLQAFPNDEAVNAALRLVLQISKIPSSPKASKAKQPRSIPAVAR